MGAKSGVVTITTAGTAVQGPSTEPGEFIIKAHPANTGYIYFGNDGAGDVSSTTGLTLGSGESAVVRCENLNQYWFDSSVNGEKATWLKSASSGKVNE